MDNLDTLEVYIVAKEYRKEVAKLARTFPKEELYLLTAQMRDSSRSITANIAEGYGRFYYQDSIKFYRISRGSLLETYDHLSSALDEGYITDEKFLELKLKQGILLRKMNAYIKYLKGRKEND